MDGGDLAVSDELTHEITRRLFLGEVDGRGRTFLATGDLAQPQRLAEMPAGVPDHEDRFALGLEGDGGAVSPVMEPADTADGGRRTAGGAGAVVVLGFFIVAYVAPS